VGSFLLLGAQCEALRTCFSAFPTCCSAFPILLLIHSVELCALAARPYQSQKSGPLTRMQGRSQDFFKWGGAEVMEAKALKRKNCL